MAKKRQIFTFAALAAINALLQGFTQREILNVITTDTDSSGMLGKIARDSTLVEPKPLKKKTLGTK